MIMTSAMLEYQISVPFNVTRGMDQDQLPEVSAAMSWGYHAELWVDDSFHRFKRNHTVR